MTIKQALSQEIQVLGVIINALKKDEAGIAKRTNLQIIEDLSKVPILGIIPYSPKINLERGEPGNIIDLLREKIGVEIGN